MVEYIIIVKRSQDTRLYLTDIKYYKYSNFSFRKEDFLEPKRERSFVVELSHLFAPPFMKFNLIVFIKCLKPCVCASVRLLLKLIRKFHCMNITLNFVKLLYFHAPEFKIKISKMQFIV